MNVASSSDTEEEKKAASPTPQKKKHPPKEPKNSEEEEPDEEDEEDKEEREKEEKKKKQQAQTTPQNPAPKKSIFKDAGIGGTVGQDLQARQPKMMAQFNKEQSQGKAKTDSQNAEANQTPQSQAPKSDQEPDSKLGTMQRNNWMPQFTMKSNDKTGQDDMLYDNRDKPLKIPRSNHLAIFIMGDRGIIRRDMLTTFKLKRDYGTHAAWAIFNKGFMQKPIQVPFYAKLAAQNNDGTYTAFFEATTYTQTTYSQDPQVANFVNQLTTEVKLEVQGLIAVTNKLEAMFAETKSWLRENLVSLLMAFAVIILAIAIFYQTGTMAGLTDAINKIFPQISGLNGIGQSVLTHFSNSITNGNLP